MSDGSGSGEVDTPGGGVKEQNNFAELRATLKANLTPFVHPFKRFEAADMLAHVVTSEGWRRPARQVHSMDEVAELEHADPNAVLLWDINGANRVACVSDLMVSEAEWVSFPMTVLWESGDSR